MDQHDGLDDELDEGDDSSSLDGHNVHDGHVSSDYDGSVMSDLTSIRSDFIAFEYDNGRHVLAPRSPGDSPGGGR